ncbi:MAG: quinone-dependent dihydroorotate dehydrogenase [Spirochaetia bacterium]|nr:quinone-dependent dihydroorotate dehydrogenase [Spirochaetia bacterium]
MPAASWSQNVPGGCVIKNAYASLFKPLFFRLDPEHAHELVAGLGRIAASLPALPRILETIFRFQDKRLESTVCGIRFPNPVGMAAGFDKTGALYPFLRHMGFGFVECGTFTAHGQPGNPKPRLFRFPEEAALVNRMGFNNPGAEAAAKEFAGQKRTIPRGINIGKSKVTALEDAVGDYIFSLEHLLPHGDYIALNVSSPNTPGLRTLQGKEPLRALIAPVKSHLAGRKPLFVKVAPDLTDSELDDVLDVIQELSVDGIIATNTTIDKSSVARAAGMEGGLSGRPLGERSTEFVKKIRARLPKVALMGVGGIFSADDAMQKLDAGADLVQIYTSYIYEGPELPARINCGIAAIMKKRGLTLEEMTTNQRATR